jgi:hypothetical protein
MGNDQNAATMPHMVPVQRLQAARAVRMNPKVVAWVVYCASLLATGCCSIMFIRFFDAAHGLPRPLRGLYVFASEAKPSRAACTAHRKIASHRSKRRALTQSIRRVEEPFIHAADRNTWW